MTLKLWLGLRDTDVGVLVEEVAVVASEVIVRLALVTTKANARVYETGSDILQEARVGLACQRSCLGEIACDGCSFRVLYGIFAIMKRSRSRNEGSDEEVPVGGVS